MGFPASRSGRTGTGRSLSLALDQSSGPKVAIEFIVMPTPTQIGTFGVKMELRMSRRTGRLRFAGIMERARAKHRRAKLAADQARQQEQEPEDSANDNSRGHQLAEAAVLGPLRARAEKLD